MTEQRKNVSGLLHTLLYLIAVGSSVFLLLFFVAMTWIGFEVHENCNKAQARYGGNCTHALASLLDDVKNDYRARNDAIWALGQLGNNESLPILRKYYTGKIPEREPLNKTISQYELKKAIRLAEGGTNITAVFWRHGGF